MTTKSQEMFSSLFNYHENIIICSYVPKKRKTVILLSTMYHNDSASGLKEKYEMIYFYNKKKSGVDIMDKLLE